MLGTNGGGEGGGLVPANPSCGVKDTDDQFTELISLNLLRLQNIFFSSDLNHSTLIWHATNSFRNSY